MATRKKPWYKDPMKLNIALISLAAVILLFELFNMYEIRQIRNDLFGYYLWP